MTGSAAELLDGTTGWLAEHLEWFSPQRWARFLPCRPFPPGPALELLGLCRCLRRGPAAAGTAALGETALDLGAQLVDADAFRDGLYRCDHLFSYHLYLLALVHSGGRRRPDLLDAAGRLLDATAGVRAGALRSTQELVELRYVLDVAELAATLPAMDVLVTRSALATGLPPAPLTDNEVYALTHLVFYATDFAGRRAVAVAPDTTGLVRALTGVYAAVGNLDLTGELLLCADALGLDLDGVIPERVVAQGWRTLLTGQRPDGSVPSPLFDPVVDARLTGEQRVAYRFGTSYHTTIVAAMAATAREGRRARPV